MAHGQNLTLTCMQITNILCGIFCKRYKKEQCNEKQTIHKFRKAIIVFKLD